MHSKLLACILLLIASSGTCADDSMDLTQLLEALRLSDGSEQQISAIRRLSEKEGNDRVILALAKLLTAESSDETVRDASEMAIIRLLRDATDLRAPRELIDGLNKTSDIRRRVTSVLAYFHAFEVAAIPILLDELREDDRLFIAISGVFVDIERLQKLTESTDFEIRSSALSRLWSATRDVDICLRSWLRVSDMGLSPEFLTRCREIEEKVNNIEDKLGDLSAEDLQREELELERHTLIADPALREQNRFSLSQLALALFSYNITMDRPIDCGVTLKAVISNCNEPLTTRRRAAQLLTAIVKRDEPTRQKLVGRGIGDAVRTAAQSISDVSTKEALQVCFEALTTPRDDSTSPMSRSLNWSSETPRSGKIKGDPLSTRDLKPLPYLIPEDK
jgi:hypothetical protein